MGFLSQCFHDVQCMVLVSILDLKLNMCNSFYPKTINQSEIEINDEFNKYSAIVYFALYKKCVLYCFNTLLILISAMRVTYFSSFLFVDKLSRNNIN